MDKFIAVTLTCGMRVGLNTRYITSFRPTPMGCGTEITSELETPDLIVTERFDEVKDMIAGRGLARRSEH